MNDRELLELAAKAAGIGGYWDDSYAAFVTKRNASGIAQAFWCPLSDDGDALRLQTTLGLSVEPYPYYTDPKHSVIVKQRRRGDQMRESNPTQVVELYRDSDPQTATRRAIVRAAAEIGKAIVNAETATGLTRATREFMRMIGGRRGF